MDRVVTLIKANSNQENRLRVEVRQPDVFFPLSRPQNKPKVHKLTIENYRLFPKEMLTPIAVLKKETVHLFIPPSSRDLSVYIWSDCTSTASSESTFYVKNAKTIHYCVVNEKAKLRSQIESVDADFLRKKRVFVPKKTITEIPINNSIKAPVISKSNNSITITGGEQNSSILTAWTTDPSKGYRFTSEYIQSDAGLILSFALNLNTFTRSSCNKHELQALGTPTISVDSLNSTVTIDSGNPSTTLSIKGELHESIITDKSRLTFHYSCLTRKNGLRFYGNQHNARQSEPITVPGTTFTTTKEFILNEGAFYVVQDLGCFRECHSIEAYKARIPFFHSGQLKEVMLPAFVCKDCSKVYIFEPNLWDIPHDYEYARRFIRPTGELFKGPPSGLKGIMNDSSPLKKCGYTTGIGGPSDLTRLQILKRMIDLRVFGSKSKERICGYLEFFIKNNNNKNSIETWRKDRELISGYAGNHFLSYFNSVYNEK